MYHGATSFQGWSNREKGMLSVPSGLHLKCEQHHVYCKVKTVTMGPIFKRGAHAPSSSQGKENNYIL